MSGAILKGIGVLVWLGAAAACDREPRLRKVMAYAGAVLALLHAGAIAGAKLEAELRSPGRDGLGAPILGFVAGAALGALCGIPLGALSLRSRALYAITHLAAALFVAYLPLVRI